MLIPWGGENGETDLRRNISGDGGDESIRAMRETRGSWLLKRREGVFERGGEAKWYGMSIASCGEREGKRRVVLLGGVVGGFFCSPCWISPMILKYEFLESLEFIDRQIVPISSLLSESISVEGSKAKSLVSVLATSRARGRILQPRVRQTF